MAPRARLSLDSGSHSVGLILSPLLPRPTFGCTVSVICKYFRMQPTGEDLLLFNIPSVPPSHVIQLTVIPQHPRWTRGHPGSGPGWGPRSRGRYPQCESSLCFSTLSPTALSGFADNRIQYPSYSPRLNGLPCGKDNIRKWEKLYDF